MCFALHDELDGADAKLINPVSAAYSFCYLGREEAAVKARHISDNIERKCNVGLGFGGIGGACGQVIEERGEDQVVVSFPWGGPHVKAHGSDKQFEMKVRAVCGATGDTRTSRQRGWTHGISRKSCGACSAWIRRVRQGRVTQFELRAAE